MRDIADLKVATDPARSFPMLFFITAHAKVCISIELGFSGCIQEARSIMRDAVESAAFGHYMVRKPNLQEVWLRKDDPNGQKAFSQAFEKDKKQRLFAGLDELHRAYSLLSEIGSHVNPLSPSSRLQIANDDRTRSFLVAYTGSGVDETTLVTSIFSLLLTCFTIENTFFDDYNNRLSLDHTLIEIRHEFDRYKEHLRRRIISKYSVAPPSDPKATT